MSPIDTMTTTRPTKTITIELPLEFAEKVEGIDLAVALMMCYCGKCGEDINGQETKYHGGAMADHQRCGECDLSYCDKCVEECGVPVEEFLCRCCAETDAGFQKCDGEECEHYRWGDDGHWVCRERLGDKVLCPECDGKLTADPMVVYCLKAVYESEDAQRAFITREGLDDEPGVHICWLALEDAVRNLLTDDEADELGGENDIAVLKRLAERYGLPLPPVDYPEWGR